jgi:hypothetical protein
MALAIAAFAMQTSHAQTTARTPLEKSAHSASAQAAAHSSATHEEPYVFAYFKEPGSQGIYLALSRDGYTFTPLNDGQPWLKTEVPGELMRDVFLTQTPDGKGYRMVWTWAWHGNAIGTADSPDLFAWSPQRRIEIMKDYPTVQNTWAPETYWDTQKKQWLVLWSSSFNAPDGGLRLWAARTTDFLTFTKPEKFFDRGFPVIDATMFHRELGGKKDVVMVLKDQSIDPLRYNERWVAGPSVEGPWGAVSGPIDESWSEGPSVIQEGKIWIVYYDHYRAPRARYEGVATTDWVHWTSVNNRMHFPKYAKHGSFFRVTEAEAQRLLARHDPPSPDASTKPSIAGDSPIQ